MKRLFPALVLLLMCQVTFGESLDVPLVDPAFAKPETDCHNAWIYANDNLSWAQKIEADLLNGWWLAEEADTWQWIDFHADGYAEMVVADADGLHYRPALWRLDMLLSTPVLVLHTDGFDSEQRYLLAPDCEGMTFAEVRTGRHFHFRHLTPAPSRLPAGIPGTWQRVGTPAAASDLLAALRSMHLDASGQGTLLVERPGQRVARLSVSWQRLPQGMWLVRPVDERLSANEARPMVWQVRVLDSGELLVTMAGTDRKPALLVQ